MHGRMYPPPKPKPQPPVPKFGQHTNKYPVSHIPANYDEEDSFDESDEDDVYFNEDPSNFSPAPMQGRQANRTSFPPAKPNVFNPKPIVPKKPPPPSKGPQPQGDDMYLPIVDSLQGNHRRFDSHSSYNPPGPITSGRPSYPPPSPNRPPIPTPTDHDASRPPLDFRSSRTDRKDPSPHSSFNKNSPISSPGPPSRGSSDRSSGPRLPQRDGSRSSQDSSGSNPSDRSDHGRHQSPHHAEQKHGSFQKSKNVPLPGFGSSTFPLPSKSDTRAMPPMRPYKPEDLHVNERPSSFDSKPSTLSKPSNLSNSLPPRGSAVSNELSNRFNDLFRATPNVVEKRTWFKEVDRSQAMAMINANPQEGRFIVRPGKSKSLPYSLTVYASGSIFNLQVRLRADQKFALGTEKANEMSFTSVMELIDYHMNTAVVLAADKGSVLLTGPP